MIEIKELINKVHDYESKQCVGFEYNVNFGDKYERKHIILKFTKINDLTWNLQALNRKTSMSETQIYDFDFEIPKKMMALNKVAAIGLAHFKMCLKNEIQDKIALDFEIGSIMGVEI